MTHAVGIAQAKAQFAKLVDRAQAGEEIVLTRNGKAVARIVPMDGQGSVPADVPREAPAPGGVAPPERSTRSPSAPKPIAQRAGLTLVEMMKLTR